MTPESTVAPVTAMSMAAAAGSAAGLGMPFVALGVPIWGLLAGLVGAFCSYLPRHATDDRHIPMRLLSIFSDAVLGGWLAVFAINLPALADIGVQSMPIEILCGGAAFGMQWLRLRAGPLLEQLAGGVVTAATSTIMSWARRKPPAPPAGDAE